MLEYRHNELRSVVQTLSQRDSSQNHFFGKDRREKEKEIDGQKESQEMLYERNGGFWRAK